VQAADAVPATGCQQATEEIALVEAKATALLGGQGAFGQQGDEAGEKMR
jgi:hypothetical protein